jgi:hypothetical protein
MRWKYWIHHTWPDERTRWAEAFVRPEDPNSTGESLWLTIDCVETVAGTGTNSMLDEESEKLRQWLGDTGPIAWQTAVKPAIQTSSSMPATSPGPSF